MEPKFFRNRFEKDRITKIIAHNSQVNISRCKMDDCLEEISQEEAFRIVRNIGCIPYAELYGISLEGFEHNDRRRQVSIRENVPVFSMTVPKS